MTLLDFIGEWLSQNWLILFAIVVLGGIAGWVCYEVKRAPLEKPTTMPPLSDEQRAALDAWAMRGKMSPPVLLDAAEVVELAEQWLASSRRLIETIDEEEL